MFGFLTRRSTAVQFSSVQDGIYALGKAHMRSTPSLRSFPNVAFETVPMFVWLTMALSRPFKEDRLALLFFKRLSPPGDGQWYDVLGFVPAYSVSSFSTHQIFQCVGCLWGFLFLPVYPLGHFPSLRHVQGSTPTGVFEGGHWPLTHSSLGFPIPPFVEAHWICEDDGMCGLTVTSWGNPAEDMGDCLHLHCQAGGSARIGRFSEAGLLEWMRFVIFRARNRERSQRTSGPISEQALLHAVYNSGSWN